MLDTTRPYGARVRAFTSAVITTQVAREPWQLRGYWALRREIFCEETQLFDSQLSERDEHDRQALPIVALAHCAGAALDVVGIVRIYRAPRAVWYGGRLGVSTAYRTRPRVGVGLIDAAVSTAKGAGCETFLATVLADNVPYFQRRHFTPVREVELCGRAHVLMRAELAAFTALPAAISGRHEAA